VAASQFGRDPTFRRHRPCPNNPLRRWDFTAKHPEAGSQVGPSGFSRATSRSRELKFPELRNLSRLHPWTLGGQTMQFDQMQTNQMQTNQKVENTYRTMNMCLSAFFVVALVTVGAVWAYQSKDTLRDPLGVKAHIKQTHSNVMSEVLQRLQSGSDIPQVKPAFDTTNLKMMDWSKVQGMQNLQPSRPQSQPGRQGWGTGKY
jgi:hypothetical protein